MSGAAAVPQLLVEKFEEIIMGGGVLGRVGSNAGTVERGLPCCSHLIIANKT